MRQVMTVFGYTFREAVGKKSFIISTIIMLVLITALCATPAVINLINGGNETSNIGHMIDSTGDAAAQPGESAQPLVWSGKMPDTPQPYACLYIDEQGLIPDAVRTLSLAFPNTTFMTGTAADLEAARALCSEEGDLSILIVTPMENGEPFMEAVTRDFMSGISAKDAADALSRQRTLSILNDLGADEAVRRAVTAKMPYSASIAGSMNVSGYTMGILLTMLIFFAIYFYGYGVSMSVATEKTTRVMETLVVSARPSRILIGKCVAMGTVGLLQFGGVIGYTALMFKLLVPEGTMLLGMALDISAFTARSALWVFVYFILGYALYAVLNAVCGAMVSKIEDLNTAMMPVMLVAMISFYLGYITAIVGDTGIITKVAMYLPFSAPFIMPFKLLNGAVATSDLIISSALLLVGTLLLARISIRVYEASVLHYGKRLGFKDLKKLKV